MGVGLAFESMAEIEVADQSELQILDEQRVLLTEQVVAAFDSLARSTSLGASVGDVSVRVPGTDSILATPLTPFVERITAKDLLDVTMTGRLRHKRGRPGFSLGMHLEIYRQRPDVNAIVHCHAPVATVLGICDLPIPPVTFDSMPFIDLPRVPAAVPQDAQWAQDVAARLANGAPAALLLHHGIVAVGPDVQQAVRRIIALEETARILVLCHLMQQVPATLPSEAVEILRNALV